MTHIERNTLRTRLENTLSDLLHYGSRDREYLTVEASSEELDRLQQANDRDDAIRNLERNSTILQDVRDALRRMDAGLYGICVGCEEDIRPKRLAAVPWASSCIACQAELERLQKNPDREMEPHFLTAA